MLSTHRNVSRGGFIPALMMLATFALAHGARAADEPKAGEKKDEKAEAPKEAKKVETITLGAGCYWCVEAVLQRIKGVESVKSGFSGGKVKNPTYEAVCSGETGHAEVVQVSYDPAVVPTDKLLEVFFQLHDPTTLNRQGADVGTQYRSAIFYHTEEQKKAAKAVKKKLEDAKEFDRPIVTEITKFEVFYPADDYHQNFYNSNLNNRYCRAVIVPKLEKLGLELKPVTPGVK